MESIWKSIPCEVTIFLVIEYTLFENNLDLMIVLYEYNFCVNF